MTEPLACPICGGTAFSIEFHTIVRGRVIARLVCAQCDEDFQTHGPFSEPRDTPEEAEQAAIRAWNALVASRY